MLQVVDEAEAVPIRQQAGDGLALGVADFEGEQAVGFECGARLGNEAAKDVEAGWACIQSGPGFKVADLWMEGVAVGGGNVGWVGDDCVEGLAGRERNEEIGFDEANAAGEVMARSVGGGDFEGGG